MKAIIGKKLGMTQIFDDRGNVIPVTVIEATPNTVTQIKTTEKDGYEAVQLGFGEAKHIAKPQEGHLKKSKSLASVLREFANTTTEAEVEGEARLNDAVGQEVVALKVGDKVAVDVFAEGDMIQVSGVSKGKGFAGTIKRHNFHRGPKTHGSHNYRAPGSIGSGYPEHVMKGRKLPGHMGHEQVTVKNLKVVKVDKENNIIAIRGAVPGPRKGIVLIEG